MFERKCSKKVELPTKVYEHAKKVYSNGFRMLTLGWSDGTTFLSVNSILLSSEKKDKRMNEAVRMDKRTLGFKRRQLSMTKETSAMLELLDAAKAMEIPASYVLFDSWFSSPSTLHAVKEIGYVMSCLITHMNIKDNTCFLSIKTIAKCCSISINTVKRALDDLVTAGFVEKEVRFIKSKNGAQSSNLYRLSVVFTATEQSKEKMSVLESNDKEYGVVSFEDLKEENSTDTPSQEQPDNDPLTSVPKKRLTVIDKTNNAISEIERSVNVISSKIQINIPYAQLLCIPP